MTIGTEGAPRSKGAALPLLERGDALEQDALALHRALSELIRIYQFRDRDRICCYDVSVAQCYALEAVVLHGPLTLNELAAQLYLDKSTTSRLVDALQRKGYVERREHPADRRALELEATSTGKALHEQIERDVLVQEAQLLVGFSPEVRQSMVRLVGDLARVAATRIDTSGGTCCTIS